MIRRGKSQLARRGAKWAALVAPALLLATRGLALAGDGYETVVAGAQETSSAPLLVTIAYGLIWTVVLGYVVSIWRRQKRLAAELEQLRQRVARGQPG